tara:strand:- start:5850 stop:6353 length:504 start_codon:yes stop_codon:yes gene_type:complete
MAKITKKPENSGNTQVHKGDKRSAPYPTSRLAPPVTLTELAKELELADLVVSSKVNAQLTQIADQIRYLKKQARDILEDAHEDMSLHRAKCNFKKIPGKIYHLYRDSKNNLYFSMLSPSDWKGNPPHQFINSYNLESDLSWVPIDRIKNMNENEIFEILSLDDKSRN